MISSLHGTKSDLLRCLEKYIKVKGKPMDIDAELIDGAALVHMLQPKACLNFEDYISRIIKPYIFKLLETTKRIDIIWDIYIEKSLKESTREMRGKGSRKLVRLNTTIPRNWFEFLRHAENKKDLFSLISNYFKNVPLAENKVLVCNNNEETFYNSSSSDIIEMIGVCNHEEADSRIFVHSLNCLQNN